MAGVLRKQIWRVGGFSAARLLPSPCLDDRDPSFRTESAYLGSAGLFVPLKLRWLNWGCSGGRGSVAVTILSEAKVLERVRGH